MHDHNPLGCFAMIALAMFGIFVLFSLIGLAFRAGFGG